MLRDRDLDLMEAERMNAGDAAGFWAAVPEARSELHQYGQWNIDPRSVVTFAALAFQR